MLSISFFNITVHKTILWYIFADVHAYTLFESLILNIFCTFKIVQR